MNENGKRPSTRNKNKYEKKLGSWITVQLLNYKTKKFNMKREKIRKSWEEFVNDDKYKTIIYGIKNKNKEKIDKLLHYLLNNKDINN